MLAAGIAENDRDIVYNTYVIVGPDGYIGKSRKIHIPPAEVGYWRGGGNSAGDRHWPRQSRRQHLLRQLAAGVRPAW